jgi:hypothetical protein
VEVVEVDAERYDEAIHILKRLTYEAIKERKGFVKLGENHIVGHLRHAIDVLYDAIR